MFQIRPHLVPNLYGFLPGRSTQSCFAEYFIREGPSSQEAFIDLQTAFDTANREIILEQLASFGVKGRLLTWLRGYLSNRTASVLFKGVKSKHCAPFGLGTPQGGVLSPTLFHVLILN